MPINKTLKPLFLCWMMLLLSGASFGQTSLLEGHGEENIATSNIGPNRLHYVYGYSGLSLSMDDAQEDYLQIKTGSSWAYTAGLIYKLRLFEYMAVGAEANWSIENFRIKQKDSKVFPSNVKQDKEYMRLQTLRMGAYLRIDFKNRGDVIASHMDLGGYLDWNVASLHVTKNANDDPSIWGSGSQVVKNRGLQYIETFGYSAQARIFFGHFGLNIQYRLSNFFKEEIEQLELPRLRLGLYLPMG